jgi:hypothetical protein
VVVLVGVTFCEPPVRGSEYCWEFTLLVITTDVAFVAVTCSTVTCEAVIVPWLALIETFGGPFVTETVVLAVALPPSPDALIVYVVVLAGVTLMLPDVSTLPTESKVAVVAFVEVQLNVALSPWMTAGGCAVSVTVGSW